MTEHGKIKSIPSIIVVFGLIISSSEVDPGYSIWLPVVAGLAVSTVGFILGWMFGGKKP